jgi:hypothetical protein
MHARSLSGLALPLPPLSPFGSRLRLPSTTRQGPALEWSQSTDANANGRDRQEMQCRSEAGLGLGEGGSYERQSQRLKCGTVLFAWQLLPRRWNGCDGIVDVLLLPGFETRPSVPVWSSSSTMLGWPRIDHGPTQPIFFRSNLTDAQRSRSPLQPHSPCITTTKLSSIHSSP